MVWGRPPGLARWEWDWLESRRVGGTERSEIVRGPEDKMTLSMRVLWSPRWEEGLAEEKIGGFDVGEARGQSGARLQIWPDDVQLSAPSAVLLSASKLQSWQGRTCSSLSMKRSAWAFAVLSYSLQTQRGALNGALPYSPPVTGEYDGGGKQKGPFATLREYCLPPCLLLEPPS
jgi:hypothetical protein